MKRVICVVEDEKDLNELVKSYLEKEGYEVRSYLTFEDAYQHMDDDDVHLWILDIMLDDKSGFDLIDEIKAVRLDAETKRVYMPGEIEFDRERENRARGGVPLPAFLRKELAAIGRLHGLDLEAYI